MTRYVGLARASVCAAVLISVCAVARPAYGLVGPPRYASPTGSGTDCTQAAPCGIVEAIDNATSDVEVIIEPGVYGSASSPLTTQLSDSATSGLTIHGQNGAPNPLVYSATSDAAIFLGNSSSLSHLSVAYSGPTGAVLNTGGDADHLGVFATAASSYACGVFGDLSDSLCVDIGANGAAVELEQGGGTSTYSLENDTAIATSGVGILTAAGFGAQISINAVDTIVRGTQDDVAASADSGSVNAVHLAHSAYRPGQVNVSGAGSATVVNDGGSTAANPKFVNPNAADFREAAGSPTIDKGAQRIGADTDLAGNPRTLGKTTDMGAYEFLPKPHVGKINVGHKGTHSLAVKVPVNPEGLATSVRLVARHGHQHKKSHRVLAGDERTNRSMKLKVKGLHPGTKYHLVVKATNDAGSASRNATATATPKHKHHHSRAA